MIFCYMAATDCMTPCNVVCFETGTFDLYLAVGSDLLLLVCKPYSVHFIVAYIVTQHLYLSI